jgi:hypothetical protein
MCSTLTDEICNQNGLSQIDLKNSQFTLLSHILTDKLDTDDFKRFKALSISGKLYDYITEELSLQTRKEGKIGMFEILFSSRKNNTKNKAKLKTLFPSVIKWIDDFKASNGDDAFSIMLQKYESKIFVDNILVKLKKKGLFALTKHDSVIVRDKDLEAVNEIITNEFNKINLEYTLDIKTSIKTEENTDVLSNDNTNNISEYILNENDRLKDEFEGMSFEQLVPQKALNKVIIEEIEEIKEETEDDLMAAFFATKQKKLNY